MTDKIQRYRWANSHLYCWNKNGVFDQVPEDTIMIKLSDMENKIRKIIKEFEEEGFGGFYAYREDQVDILNSLLKEDKS